MKQSRSQPFFIHYDVTWQKMPELDCPWMIISSTCCFIIYVEHLCRGKMVSVIYSLGWNQQCLLVALINTLGDAQILFLSVFLNEALWWNILSLILQNASLTIFISTKGNQVYHKNHLRLNATCESSHCTSHLYNTLINF